MSRRATWILLAAAIGLVLVGTPGTEAAYERDRPALEEDLAARTFHIDAAELLGLMHNNRISLAILDVRDEADFNLFHLRDARRLMPEPMTRADLPLLPPLTVSVIVSNDEARAEVAWMRLRALGVQNVYLLAGGINGWLDLYRPGRELPWVEGDEHLRHEFDTALGARVPAAAPAKEQTPKRPFEPKVMAPKPVASEGGGCG